MKTISEDLYNYVLDNLKDTIDEVHEEDMSEMYKGLLAFTQYYLNQDAPDVSLAKAFDNYHKFHMAFNSLCKQFAIDNYGFPLGAKVRVTNPGRNASNYTIEFNIPLNGVYAIPDWQKKVFVIGGARIPIIFSHSPSTHGAYPLLLDGTLVGFVYNTALELVTNDNSTK